MQYDVPIYFQLVFACKSIYIWLNMAIYTHTCIYLVPKRCVRPLHSTFTPKKLVCATPIQYSYSTAPPNFHAEGCSAIPATQTFR